MRSKKETVETICLWIFAIAFCCGLYWHRRHVDHVAQMGCRRSWTSETEATFSRLIDKELAGQMTEEERDQMRSLRELRKLHLKLKREARENER